MTADHGHRPVIVEPEDPGNVGAAGELVPRRKTASENLPAGTASRVTSVATLRRLGLLVGEQVGRLPASPGIRDGRRDEFAEPFESPFGVGRQRLRRRERTYHPPQSAFDDDRARYRRNDREPSRRTPSRPPSSAPSHVGGAAGCDPTCPAGVPSLISTRIPISTPSTGLRKANEPLPRNRRRRVARRPRGFSPKRDATSSLTAWKTSAAGTPRSTSVATLRSAACSSAILF